MQLGFYGLQTTKQRFRHRFVEFSVGYLVDAVFTGRGVKDGQLNAFDQICGHGASSGAEGRTDAKHSGLTAAHFAKPSWRRCSAPPLVDCDFRSSSLLRCWRCLSRCRCCVSLGVGRLTSCTLAVSWYAAATNKTMLAIRALTVCASRLDSRPSSGHRWRLKAG